MRVLVACERFGVVRDAFRLRDHDAWSCDLLPSSPASEFHFQADVRGLLGLGWDLLVAFPPCTYLAASGARWNYGGGRESRRVYRAAAIAFVRELWEAPVPRICLENPVGILSRELRKPDQIIQPYEFGHPESKRTCLWLKGLPKLRETERLRKPLCGHWENQTCYGQNRRSGERDDLRGKTYPGVGRAMAEQWG